MHKRWKGLAVQHDECQALLASHALQETAQGVILSMKVIPRSRVTALVGVRDGALVVRIAAPPFDGKANAALCAFLSELLDVPPSALTLVSGHRSPQKRVAIRGVSVSALIDRLCRVLCHHERYSG